MKANVVISGSEECEKTFPRYWRRFPNRICAKPTKYDFCNGESGIPLVKSYTKINTTEELDEQWYLEGLITKEFGCITKGTEGGYKPPSLYQRVSRYVGWIINNMQQ